MPASFLGLPPELRNEIYALLLVREEPIDPLFGDHKLATNLLATNTTILHEAGSLLYGHNRFDLTSWNHHFALQFLDIIGFVNASHLQCICIDLPELRDLSGNISLVDHSLRTLEKIQSHCTNLQTLVISAKSAYVMEDLFRSWNGQDVCSKALTFVDASFRAIPSLREIVDEVYEATPSSDITMKMQIHGWIVNVVEEVEEAEWDIDRLSDEYEDDEYPSDDYDADDYNIDNDSDFWRRAAD